MNNSTRQKYTEDEISLVYKNHIDDILLYESKNEQKILIMDENAPWTELPTKHLKIYQKYDKGYICQEYNKGNIYLILDELTLMVNLFMPASCSPTTPLGVRIMCFTETKKFIIVKVFFENIESTLQFCDMINIARCSIKTEIFDIMTKIWASPIVETIPLISSTIPTIPSIVEITHP